MVEKDLNELGFIILNTFEVTYKKYIVLGVEKIAILTRAGKKYFSLQYLDGRYSRPKDASKLERDITEELGLSVKIDYLGEFTFGGV